MTPAPSDHFDGRRFFNPGPQQRRGFSTIVRWMLTRQAATWPRWIDNVPHPPPGAMPPPGTASITWIGHASFLIRLTAQDGTGVSILIDPVFSQRCSPVQWAGPRRVRAPGLAIDGLPPIDLVLLSHNHYDHMDLPSLRAVQARCAPRIVTTAGNARTLARAGLPAATELDWWDSTDHGPLRITATPAQHFARRTPFDTNRSLWAGFMLGLDGHRLYFTGDSAYCPHFTAIRDRLGPPGIALLPIGAYLPRAIMQPVHMDPDEAVRAFQDLGAARAIAMHWGTFQLTDEDVDDPPRRLAKARQRAGLSRQLFDVLDVGETRGIAFPASGASRIGHDLTRPGG